MQQLRLKIEELQKRPLVPQTPPPQNEVSGLNSFLHTQVYLWTASVTYFNCIWCCCSPNGNILQSQGCVLWACSIWNFLSFFFCRRMGWSLPWLNFLVVLRHYRRSLSRNLSFTGKMRHHRWLERFFFFTAAVPVLTHNFHFLSYKSSW